jgi:hypothetical protein
MSTEAADTKALAPTEPEASTALVTPEELEAREAALVAAQESEFAEGTLQVPILKATQGLTQEVKDGDAEEGQFLNSLTGEQYGSTIEFVGAYYVAGHQTRHKGNLYTTTSPTIPENWAQSKGGPVPDEFTGQPFSEYHDSEEQFRKDVNEGHREWGSGPPISIAHNYTGYVIPPLAEGEEERAPEPVRLTLVRSQAKAHNKINSLRQVALRGKPLYDRILVLSLVLTEYGEGSAYAIKVKLGGPTPTDLRLDALQLAEAVQSGRVKDNAEAADDTPEEAAPAEGAAAI